jgi:type IV pilus assembly protein PilX
MRKIPSKPHLPSLAKQHGAVLIVSLMILIMLTMISLASMQTTTLEEKMTGNTRDRNIAFQAAEAALRVAEDELGAVVLPSFNGTAYLYQPENDRWETVDWAYNATATKVIPNDITGVAQQPRFYLEELPASVGSGSSLVAGFAPPPGTGNYRATAKGFGGTAVAEVVLQATYRR